jgi:tagaturonate reductase
METLSRKLHPTLDLPERILQFGGGVFLRGFVADFVDRAIRAGDFRGRLVIAQRELDRRSEAFRNQDGLYTLWLRGSREEFRLLEAVSRALSTATEWDKVLAVAASPDLEVIVSNATEVGYSTSPNDTLASPGSFPAKLTAALHHRWQAGRPGVVIIPCELLENNGERLAAVVEELAARWQTPAAFRACVRDDTVFCSTLVDRIVTGPPPADAAAAAQDRLGYRDDLLITAEPYALFAIADRGRARQRFPIHRANPEVLYVDDAGPYWRRKLRLLNAPHTLLAARGVLRGIRTVREAMQDADMRAFVEAAMLEILAAQDSPEMQLEAFARQVLERFANPFVEHKLFNICFHCSTKAGVRLFPIIRDHHRATGKLPPRIVEGLACLLRLFRDPTRFPFEDANRERIAAAWREAGPAPTAGQVSQWLETPELWGGASLSLPGLGSALAAELAS